MRHTFLILICCFSFHLTFSQHHLGLKLFGLSIHPNGEKENASLMPNKLDKYGYFVLNLGAMASYERFFHKDVFSIKVVQAFYADCAARPGGFSHIGVRGRIFKTGRHSLVGGIGPTLIYRRSWLELEDYKNRNRFHGDEDDRWQYLFLWYGGEFEYLYQLTDKLRSAVTFVPGYPDLMSLSLGFTYELGKNKMKASIN